MTSLREHLAARRAIAERATAGTWQWVSRSHRNGDQTEQLIARHGRGRETDVVFDCSSVAYEGGGFPPCDDDIAYIAANDPTTITLMVDALLAADQMPDFDTERGESLPAWMLDLADRLAALHVHLEQEAQP